MRDWLRWATGIAFLLALAAMALPMVTVRVEFIATGSWLQLEETSTGLRAVHGLDTFAGAAAVLTLIVLAAGIATVTLRAPARPGAATAAALLAAITSTTSARWTKQWMSRLAEALVDDPSAPGGHVEYRYGLWLMVGLLVVVIAANAPALTARLTRARTPAA